MRLTFPMESNIFLKDFKATSKPHICCNGNANMQHDFFATLNIYVMNEREIEINITQLPFCSSTTSGEPIFNHIRVYRCPDDSNVFRGLCVSRSCRRNYLVRRLLHLSIDCKSVLNVVNVDRYIQIYMLEPPSCSMENMSMLHAALDNDL